MLDGQQSNASAGDLIRLPRGIPHGLFNHSQANITCLFWVSPTRKLWDLFQAIHNVPDPGEVVRLAALHEVNFLPPPGVIQRGTIQHERRAFTCSRANPAIEA